MTTRESEEDRKKDLALVGGAFRPPRGGIGERLVCQSLFQGTFSDVPSKKINHLCVACMSSESLMRSESEKNGNAKLPFDLEEINRIYALNLSFQNATFNSYGSARPDVRVASIPWGFAETEENYRLFIKPWRKNLSLGYYQKHIKGYRKPGVRIMHTNNSRSRWSDFECYYQFGQCQVSDTGRVLAEMEKQYLICPQCHVSLRGKESLRPYACNLIDENPEWKFFFVAAQHLTEASARNLRNAFENWAIPKLEKAKLAIASFVSPQTYEDVAKLLSGPEEENQNGNPANDKLRD